MEKEVSLRQAATHGVKWSVIQNWGAKLFTFVLSILLARILSPTDFGTASAVALILLLVPLAAELGFGDAIMQRRDLKPADVNLPFLVSMIIVVTMFALVVLMAGHISEWLQIGDNATYVIVASGVLLLTTPSMFQEAMYKRNMQFKSLALRTFLANIIGGLAALACAFAGFGIWSFVVQGYVAGLISAIWLWSRPQWVPGTVLDGKAFAQMTRFGLPVVFQRLVDFAGTRTIDVIIVSQLGLAAYGLYAIGSRIYLTMMQLLQGAFYDVSLTVLSTISHDRERIAHIYLKTIGLAATFISPIFILVAAVAPEVCHVLLGNDWVGVELVVVPLLLIGALQCVQFLNGPFLSARGKPEFTLFAGMTKSACAIAALLLLPSSDVQSMTTIFSLSMLAATPVTFYFIVREINVSTWSIVRTLALPGAINLISFAMVQYARTFIEQIYMPSLIQGTFLGALYVACWLALMSIFDRSRLHDILARVMQRVRRDA